MSAHAEDRVFTTVGMLFLSALVLVAGFAIPFLAIALLFSAEFNDALSIGWAAILLAALAAPSGVAYAAVRDGVSVKVISAVVALSLAPGAFFWLFVVN